jgi:hypothetical protein
LKDSPELCSKSLVLVVVVVVVAGVVVVVVVGVLNFRG